MEFNYADPWATLGTSDVGSFVPAVFLDGTARAIPRTISGDSFKSMLTLHEMDGVATVDVPTSASQWASPWGNSSLSLDTTTEKMKEINRAIVDVARGSWAFFYQRDIVNQTPIPPVGNFSWRVRLLPDIGYLSLYQQFKQDEPWDSPHNLTLLDKMPSIFKDRDGLEPGMTGFRILNGPSTAGAKLYENGVLWKTDFIDDERSILFAQVGANNAVPWTKPETFSLNMRDPIESLGDIQGILRFAMSDGYVASIPSNAITPSEFVAMATINGTLASTFASAPEEYRDPNAVFRRVKGNAIYNNEFLRAASEGFLSYKYYTTQLPNNIVNATGAPLLSWRVQILPYIGFRALYNEFHLDESWDSPHNFSLINRMPEAFRSLGDSWDSTTTRIQTFQGPNSVTNLNGSTVRLVNALDGVQDSAMFARTSEAKAVVWTKPSDIDSQADDLRAALGKITSSAIVMLDNSRYLLSNQIDSERLRNYALINDSNLLDVARPNQIVLQRGGPVQTLDGVLNWSLDKSLGIIGNVSDVQNQYLTYVTTIPRLSLSAPASPPIGTERTTLRVTQADGTVRVIELVVVDGPTINTPTPVIPQVVSTVVNSGEMQRSSLTSLTIQFNTKVNVTNQSFEVKNRTTGASIPVIIEQINGQNGSIVKLTFQESSQVIRRAIGNSLRDGWYSLRIEGALVHSQETDSTMVSDYLFGQSRSDKFYRLYGDLNGDQSVDASDLRAIARALFSTSHQLRYIEGLDIDGNGLINYLDYLSFLRNFRRRL